MLMGTGLFSHRHNLGAKLWRKQKSSGGRGHIDRVLLSNFAEALAETGTITAAAQTVGVCRQRGTQLLARIVSELGWQAQ